MQKVSLRFEADILFTGTIGMTTKAHKSKQQPMLDKYETFFIPCAFQAYQQPALRMFFLGKKLFNSFFLECTL